MIKFLKKHSLVSVSILSTILITIPITVFLYHFGKNSISNDISHWASFGDYLGGTINTILSLSSLIILGLLTNTVSKPSNEENKKVNLLLKRLDSFEKLTDYIPRIRQILGEMDIDVKSFNDSLKNKNYNVDHITTEFEKKAKFFIELNVVIQSFGIRYSHLYNYNFESSEFTSLSENILPVREYFIEILSKLKNKEPGFPTFPNDHFRIFLKTYSDVITQLRTELN
ncbi:hypothetical protein AB9T89_12930 [Flavobacterium oncorhynchi]|uniref:hypothetical protein n=1 Tax=Flavobacterium oncorhynchi TaxID=728056 RepID=UPI00351A6258